MNNGAEFSFHIDQASKQAGKQSINQLMCIKTSRYVCDVGQPVHGII